MKPSDHIYSQEDLNIIRSARMNDSLSNLDFNRPDLFASARSSMKDKIPSMHPFTTVGSQENRDLHIKVCNDQQSIMNTRNSMQIMASDTGGSLNNKVQQQKVNIIKPIAALANGHNLRNGQPSLKGSISSRERGMKENKFFANRNLKLKGNFGI